MVTAYLVEQICEGLDYAHTLKDGNGKPLGIVHRDVTPKNVLISTSGHVKIIDFGIAKAAERISVTRAGALKGGPGYISPEQAQGKPLDHRTDVFAAGIILYELMTHERLFRDGISATELRAVVEFNPAPKLRWKFQYPGMLRAAAGWALQPDVEERCPSAAQLAIEMREYLHKRSEDPRQELVRYMRDHLSKR